jgi:poly(3-hydroxybutyrate) depolymerase
MKTILPILALLLSSLASAQDNGVIAFGTNLEPKQQVAQSQALAKSMAKPGSSGWRAKGDQHRTYRFPGTEMDLGYRVYVPTTWDSRSKLPLVLMLHGAGSNESRYLDMNGKQLLTLAEQHGYLLVSPLGWSPMGAYGTCLRLPAVFGEDEAAAQQRATACVRDAEILERSEQDVINVLEIVLNEYPVDRSAMFLAGHSMGSGGTWYLGAKYAQYWKAIAPMSGPFIERSTYPWDRIRSMPVFMTEGIQAKPSLAGSRALRDWMKPEGFPLEYMEVDADHGGMIPLVLPSIFDFFDRQRTK